MFTGQYFDHNYFFWKYVWSMDYHSFKIRDMRFQINIWEQDIKAQFFVEIMAE